MESFQTVFDDFDRWRRSDEDDKGMNVCEEMFIDGRATTCRE